MFIVYTLWLFFLSIIWWWIKLYIYIYIYIYITWRKIFHILDSENFCRFSLREAKCSASVAPSMSSITMYSLSSADAHSHILSEWAEFKAIALYKLLATYLLKCSEQISIERLQPSLKQRFCNLSRLFRLDGLLSTVMPLPAVTLTFDLLTTTQFHLWSKLGKIPFTGFWDTVFTKFWDAQTYSLTDGQTRLQNASGTAFITVAET